MINGHIRKKITEYRAMSKAPASRQLAITLCCMAICCTLGVACSHHSYALSLLVAIPTAGFILRLFIIQHDCGHGSFFHSARANHLLGSLLGIITLTPYHCWRRYHALHHANAGNLDKRGQGDIRTLTVKEYLNLTLLERWKYRIYRHPFVLFAAGPFILFVIRQRLTYYISKSWRKERKSVHLTNLTIFLLLILIYYTGEFKALLLFYLSAMAIASSAGVWLFYVQHQFETTYWQPQNKWNNVEASVAGSTYYALPRFLHWLSANIGFHHIHHLDPSIPNYYLQHCFKNHTELQQPKRLSIRESFACVKLKLWDEDKQRMVHFSELKEVAK